MHEYTTGMIRHFYKACAIKTNERFIDAATAARLSQTTEQSWRSVTQQVRKGISDLVKTAREHLPKNKGPVRRGDADLSNFFGLVTSNPKTGRLSEKTRGDLNANS